MTNRALTSIEGTGTATLPVIDPCKPATPLSLPPWLARSASALKDGPVPMIPAGFDLTTDQRSKAKLLITAIDDHLAGQDRRKIGGAVTELLMAFASAPMSDAGAAARAKGYAVALEGVPSWAVQEACARWLRGDVEDGNLAFAPSPPQLRKIANAVMVPIRAQRVLLERVLSARVEEEFSAEHREEMLSRLSSALKPMGMKPKDFGESLQAAE